ncbi:glycerophosphodiester phosphodiesterase family protein [Hymenobacter koreensis]|uniref:glycerophosphodiester phosphodiesterase family protein n=1 Tax=Hymenobacter koreensis TaxID=1084523 RepID=UPI0031EE1902
MPAHRPHVYGHRGCRGLRPENTLPAFLHALHWPISGLELDVVLSADGQVVVSHEPWLNHLVCLGPDGEQLTPERGRAFNLYQEPYERIRRCDCGQLPHPAFPEQQSLPAYKPLLSEVFAAVDDYAQLHCLPLPRYSVELKSTAATDELFHPKPAAFLDAVLTVISQADFSNRVTLLSFDHRVLQEARQAVPALPTCLLIEDQLPLAEHLEQLGFQPTFLGPDFTLLTDEFLRLCSGLNLPIIAWTVNEPSDMLRLTELGIYGFTTDYPDRAAAVLRL